jgi:hypothetical protein
MIKEISGFSFPDEPSALIITPSLRLEKTAYGTDEELQAFLNKLEPNEKFAYVLVNIIGAGEFFGANSNSDYFKTSELLKSYKTFETMGNVYRHHQNKNPANASGTIPLAIWNKNMHRVELVKKLPVDTNEDILSRIERGDRVGVSMGCFLAGAMVSMEDGGRKRIEDVQVGDIVITHLGRPRRVTELHRRKYSGKIYEIKSVSHETIYATKEHPFLTVSDSEVKTQTSFQRWIDGATLDPKWVPSESIDQDNHYLLEPIIKGSLTPDFADRSFARIFGYYMAEGHIVWKKNDDGNKVPYGIELTVHEKDFCVSEIESLCKEYKTKNDPVINKRRPDVPSLSISINDPELAEKCYQYGGCFAKEKRFSKDVLLWDVEVQKEMLGAYSNGDGCWDKNKQALLLSTASESLAYQISHILGRIGIPASICEIEHKAGVGFSSHNTYEFVTFIGKTDSQKLFGYANKVVKNEIKSSIRRRCEIGNYFVTPISDISLKDVEDVDVFNFEVEEDNSYLIAGLAVHNCKIDYDICSWCGNKAKTKKDYCECLRFHRGEWRDGLACYMDNINPKFFDSSFVTRPADKSAYVLAKVAEDGASQIDEYPISVTLGEYLYGQDPETKKAEQAKKAKGKKIADIDKEIPATVTGIDSLSGLYEKFRQDGMPSLREKEAEFSSQYLDEIAKQAEDSLATLASCGVILKPWEFQRVALSSMGRPDIADRFEKQGHLFDETSPNLDYKFALGEYKEEIAKRILAGILAKSYFRNALLNRVYSNQNNDGEGVSSPRDIDTCPIHGSDQEVMSAIGGSFVDYKERAKELALTVAGSVKKLFPEASQISIKIANLHPSTYRDSRFISHQSHLGLTGVAFGENVIKLASESPSQSILTSSIVNAYKLGMEGRAAEFGPFVTDLAIMAAVLK